MDAISPVQCVHCGEAYDLADGKPVQRYAECTVFITPCCGREVDDREWKSLPDYRRLQPGDVVALVPNEDGMLRKRIIRGL